MTTAEALGAVPTPWPIRAAARLAALAGWRRYAAAFLFGGLATFALPPAGAVPVLLVAFPGLLWLLAGARTRRAAFFTGWFFGFGHFLLGLYWVSFALMTDIADLWWAMPITAAGLPILMAAFTGLNTLLLHVLERPLRLAGLARCLAFAVLWSVGEWLRGHLFTGFPWNLLGYSWFGVLPVFQAVSVVGSYGLGLLTAAAACLPAAFGDPCETPRRRLAACLAALAGFAAIGAAGAWRLDGTAGRTVPGVTLRLVQSNIPQELRWEPEKAAAQFEKFLAMSRTPAPTPPTVTLWSESAVPYLVEQDANARAAMAAAVPPGGMILTGSIRRVSDATGEPGYANGMVAVDSRGAVAGTYDKFHLVPFGEYVPFRTVLPSLPAIASMIDLVPGPGPRTLHLPGLPPVGPLICYEVIFPAAVIDRADRPAWLFNLTNDAWYGNTAGPHQHFAIAGARAVEEGLPLVRVAQTGISGIFDPYGRVVASIGLGREGILDSPLPAALDAPTVYARWGDSMLVVLLICFSLCASFARHRVP